MSNPALPHGFDRTLPSRRVFQSGTEREEKFFALFAA
jgi:hypothetical protein